MATQEILYIVDLQQTCTLSLCVSGLFQSQSTCSSTDSYISALHSPILCQFISYIQTFVSRVLELFALIHVCSPTYVRISDWKHAPAQHHPNHLLSIHTRFTRVAQLPSSLHLLVSSSPSLQLFPQQSHPKLQPSQESCPGAHGCLLD